LLDIETNGTTEDLSAKNAPWEKDVNFSISDSPPKEEEVLDPDAKAFVEDMADNWEQMRKKAGTKIEKIEEAKLGGSAGAADDLDTASE
ncbi:hypothetical protein Tco_1095904, partial [Tanacetum coccineum]